LNHLRSLLVLAYVAFSQGNRQALRVSQDALERIAAQAQLSSGIKFEVILTARGLLFHRVVSLITIALMTVGFSSAAGLL
jgi:hypothetical protein